VSTIDPASLSLSERYRLLTGIVVPRPIAWVTTLSHKRGPVNLAPFSCFTFLCYDPMLLGFVVGRKNAGRKDTAANIAATGEFVIHIPDEPLVEPVHLSAIEHGPEVSEVDQLGLATSSSETISVPRLIDVPVSLECRHHRTIEFGDIRSEFIVGLVTRIHARDGLVTDGKIDTGELNPLSRLAGPRYASIGTVREMPAVAATLASPEGRRS
jgi:flavin reductase (DIM6/NTAB) family NADH-FMN oxidoreductase RutF